MKPQSSASKQADRLRRTQVNCSSYKTAIVAATGRFCSMSESSPTLLSAPAAPKRRAWRLWQALTLPLFYPAFGLGCLLMLGLAGYARVRFSDLQQRVSWLRAALSTIARAYLATGVGLGLLRSDFVPGPGQQQYSGPVIVVANHPSLVDVIFVLAKLPQLCCVLKADLSAIPILSTLIKQLNYLSNNDPEWVLHDGARRLADGESLLIFPEGTRTKSRIGMDFRLGAAELALRAKVPVQPVVLHYDGRYLSGLGRWYEFPERQLHYSVEIGALLEPPVASADTGHRMLRRQFNAKLEQYFERRLAAGPPGLPEDQP